MYTEKSHGSFSSRFHSKKKNSDNTGLFSKSPEYDKYSSIVKLDNVPNANGSILKLLEEFKSADSREKQIRIYRVADLAAKRAEAQLNRETLSEKEALEFSEIAGIYRGFAESLHKYISPE